MINDYILYIFLKKLYLYPNIDTNNIFSQIPYDYITQYLKPIIYILNNTNDKDNIIRFINKYYKNSKNYPKEYTINKLELKTIKLILNEEMRKESFYKKINILNEENLINDNIENRTNFMYKKAIEFVNNKNKIYLYNKI